MARAIGAAVAATGQDVLRLTMEVTGLSPSALAPCRMCRWSGPGTAPGATLVNVPRYRELTRLLARMAGQGADFVTIAGNDRIMFTALVAQPPAGRADRHAPAGHADWRGLFLMPVNDLADRLRGLAGEGLVLEHIHDY